MARCIRVFLLATLAILLAASGSLAHSQITDRPKQRIEFDTEFKNDLEALAQKCDELDLTEEAAITRQWFVPRQPDKLYCFVPPAKDLLVPADSAHKNVKFWYYDHFREARRRQAERLFLLAADFANQDANASAFQILHEVLHEDPDHQKARAALGFSQMKDGSWLQDRAQIRSSKPNRVQSVVGWKRKSYWQVRSPHFKIDCTTEPETGEHLAADAERWYSVWRQVFFDYWHRGQSVKNWIEGTSSDSGSKHQFEIILFNNREQYLKNLASVEGIEISTGYYNDQQQRSFFYDDQAAKDTWRHELTHQWFQETIPTKNSPSEESGACLVEGIAMFMESMREKQTVVTLGGLDATRLQYARLRYNRDQFFVPTETTMAMGREKLQQHPDIRKIYSQSAGVCHHLMLGEKRDSFIQFLKSHYQKSGKDQSLSEFVGELNELDRTYQSWLLPVDHPSIRNLDPADQIVLSTPRSGIGDELMEQIGKCDSLEWLELSMNPVGDDGIARLSSHSKLRQLFADSTQLTDAAADDLASMKSLEQLDLSATEITDAALDKISKLDKLQVLWLAKTKVTDDGLMKLKGLSSLQVIDVRATNVTQGGVDRLKEAIPGLQVFN